MPVAIRPATPDDAALVVGFIRSLAEFERLADRVTARETDIARDLFSPSPRVFCEIAELDGASAGFALWFYTYSTFQGRHGIWLEDIFVEERFRGRGIGKSLLAHLAARCRRENLGRLAWWVLDWNEKAIGFYESLGAKRMLDWQVCRLEGDALESLGGSA